MDELRLTCMILAVSTLELLEGNLLDRVGFSSSSRFIASDVMTRDEDAIDGNDFARFEQCNVSDYHFLQRGMSCEADDKGQQNEP